jgi:DNA invertase Pin-like site-specific DNA recombinase
MDLLGIVRLSDFRENSASPAQQVELMESYARLHGHRIVHIVHDDDVSGDYGPFHPERKTAGWLNDRHAEYEGIITRKIDRVARNAEQTLRLLRWAKNRGKILISVNDGIDTSTAAGKEHAQLMAVVAEWELNRNKERAKQSYKHLTQVAKRWPGGQVPFGYRPACLNCGEIPRECPCPAGDRRGYRLVPDPEYGPALQKMVAEFLAGLSLGEIARRLNKAGVPVSRNIMRIRSGKEPTATAWTPDSVGKILRSCAMLGAVEVTDILERDDETGKVTKRSPRKPLRDDEDNLVLRAEPLVSYETWAQVQAGMSVNGGKDQGRRPRTPLLKIAYCGSCGGQLYVAATRANRYYACGQSSFRATVPEGERCPSRRIPADALEQETVQAVLDYAGSWPHKLPRISPAEEYSAPLAQVNDAIANLLEALEAGAFKGRTATFQQRMDALEQRKAELEAKPSRPAETTWEPTGKTVRDYWLSLTPDEQWNYLRDMQVKVYVSRDLAAIERVWNEMQQTRPDTITSMDDISLFTLRTWGTINLGIMWGRMPDAVRNVTRHPRQ